MLMRKFVPVLLLVALLAILVTTGAIASGGSDDDHHEHVVICHDGHTLTIDKHHEGDEQYHGHSHGVCPTPTPRPTPETITICLDGETLVINKHDEDKDKYKHHFDGACPTETQEPTKTPEPPVMCEWNEQLLASDILCVEPTPEVTPEVTPVPVVCESTDTGRVVNELIMYNTGLLHYGYWTSTMKVGVCKIEGPSGQGIPVEHQARSCECGMPEDFVWQTDKVNVWHIMKSCDGSLFLWNDYYGVGKPYGGWEFGKYCTIAGCR
jgi:hypothetical protein